MNLNKQDLRLAETIAFLHDAGRFEQYDRYRTFSDAKSEDHAQLGIKIIRQNHVLKEIAQPTSELVLRSISYHNHPTLPQKETERCLIYTKLLGDSDKLDILYVFTDYYKNGSEHPNEILELELADMPKISNEVYKHLISGGIVNARHLKTLNDFKLLQMAWIYDINFPHTFQLIQKRKYLQRIRYTLPHSDKVQKIYSAVKSYLDKKSNLRKQKIKKNLKFYGYVLLPNQYSCLIETYKNSLSKSIHQINSHMQIILTAAISAGINYLKIAIRASS